MAPRYTKGVINEHKSKGEICVKVTQLCFRKQLKIMECYQSLLSLLLPPPPPPSSSPVVHFLIPFICSLHLFRLNHCFICFHSKLQYRRPTNQYRYDPQPKEVEKKKFNYKNTARNFHHRLMIRRSGNWRALALFHNYTI